MVDVDHHAAGVTCPVSSDQGLVTIRLSGQPRSDLRADAKSCEEQQLTMTTTPLHVTLGTLNLLPPPSRFRELCVANAALDSILMPEWEYRYFSFDSKWGAGEEMASLRDGSGTDHFCLFTEAGVLVKGFDPNSPLNPSAGAEQDWRTSGVPPELRPALGEPAFDMAHITFCLWSTEPAGPWRCGTPPSESLLAEPLGFLSLLTDDARVYAMWSSEYYERDVSVEAVQALQRLTPLDQVLLGELNSQVALEAVREGMAEIGYPLS